MFRMHGCGVYAARLVAIVDGIILPLSLLLVRCVLQCSGSEPGVKQSDAIDFVSSVFQV